MFNYKNYARNPKKIPTFGSRSATILSLQDELKLYILYDLQRGNRN